MNPSLRTSQTAPESDAEMSPPAECEPVLILGVGNILLMDDGVGVHVARRLQIRPPPGTAVVDVGTDFPSAIPHLQHRRAALVIDAMDTGGPPGSIYYCPWEDVRDSCCAHSVHEMGLRSVVESLGRNASGMLHVLGVQPARIGYGLHMSPEVIASLDAVAQAACEIAGLLTQDCHSFG